MSRVRVLVGTRKGAFVLTSDATRERWDIGGPHFGGWEIYHLKGSPADPNRLYASQSSSWFGQVIQRSNDGGKTWQTAGNKLTYEGVPGTHLWYAGTPRCSARLTALRRGRSCPVCADTSRRRSGSRAPAVCACTRSCWTRAIPGGSSSPSRQRVCSAATTPARRGSPCIAGC